MLNQLARLAQAALHTRKGRAEFLPALERRSACRRRARGPSTLRPAPAPVHGRRAARAGEKCGLARRIRSENRAVRLLDLTSPRQQRVQVAEFVDQQRRRLDADAGNAGTLSVESPARDWISTTRSGATPNFSITSAGPIGLDFIGSNIVTARPDQLHHVLVGRDDDHLFAAFHRQTRIGRDQVVGLVTVKLDPRQAERLGRLADQGELRNQFRRRGVAFALYWS